MDVRRLVKVLLLFTCLIGNTTLAQEDELAIQTGAVVSSMLEVRQPLRWIPGQIIDTTAPV